MAVHPLQKGQVTRPARKVCQTTRLPAPSKGMDARVAMSQSDMTHCVYTINLMPYEYGMQTRKGYREWSINLDNGLPDGNGVKTIIPFDGIEENGVKDKLFATTNEGIWDVTANNDTPVLVYAFANTDEEAGIGVYSHYVDNAGRDLLYYADRSNGGFEYDPETEVWGVMSGINGPAIGDIRQLLVHKQRLWLVEKDSTNAWYLPIGATSGQATKFQFGSKFRHGGHLAGIFSWTVDGGSGVDDLFVAVSRAGDVIVYQGEDPSSSDTWAMKGVWFIGEVPKNPYFGSEHGGELYLLSSSGLVGMNDLLKGVSSFDAPEFTVAAKVTGLLRQQMLNALARNGWAVRSIPSEGALLVSTPLRTSLLEVDRTIQYFYNFATRAWGTWRDVPMTCFDTWKGHVVFGTEDNRVCYMDTSKDEVKLNPVDPQLNGKAIEFSILSSYTDFNSYGTFKRVQHIRADFIGSQKPALSLKAVYDFRLDTFPPPLAKASYPQGEWDVSEWDAAIWGSGRGESDGINKLYGGWGTGRHVAIAMTGRTEYSLRFMGWDVTHDMGGTMLL